MASGHGKRERRLSNTGLQVMDSNTDSMKSSYRKSVKFDDAGSQFGKPKEENKENSQYGVR